MNIPKALFIDTSIFDGLAYNFKSTKFGVIRSLGKKFRLKLLIPDPIEREINRHIADRSESAVKSLENTARKAPFLTQLDSWPLKNNEKTALVYQLQAHVEKELLDFFDNFEVIKLDYTGVDINEIMNWYNWKYAPFSDKKKSEFPDAFAVACLNQYHKTSGDNIAVVSSDGDYNLVCQRYKHFLYFPSLTAYAEAVQYEDERIEKIHKILSADDLIIRNAISEEFPDLTFLVEANWDGEVYDIELIDFNEIEYHVIGTGHHNYIISFDAEIFFSAYVSYWDLETAVYDEGEAYPLFKIEGRIEQNSTISGTCKITTDEAEKEIIDCNNIEFDQDYISIDAVPDEY